MKLPNPSPPASSPSSSDKDGLAGLRQTAAEVSGELATGELPDGWRQKIIEIWRGSLFAEMHEVSRNQHTKPYILGFNIGFVLCFDKIVRTESFTQKEREYLSTTFTNSLQGVAKEGMAQMSSAKWRGKILNQAQKLPLKEAREFFDGLSRGLNSVFRDERTLKYDHTTTGIYMFLMQSPEVDQFETVEQIYNYAKARMGADLPHSILSFQKLCHRIGLRGQTAKRRQQGTRKDSTTGHGENRCPVT